MHDSWSIFLQGWSISQEGINSNFCGDSNIRLFHTAVSRRPFRNVQGPFGRGIIFKQIGELKKNNKLLFGNIMIKKSHYRAWSSAHIILILAKKMANFGRIIKNARNMLDRASLCAWKTQTRFSTNFRMCNIYFLQQFLNFRTWCSGPLSGL